MKAFKTEQESFWAGDFGQEYMKRNQGDKLLASNVHFFSKAFSAAGKLTQFIELGANIGMNLKALKILYPEAAFTGIEINENAAKQLAIEIGMENVVNDSILDMDTTSLKSEVVLIKGVLIHINPEKLSVVYEKLFEISTRYILIAEYYNPVATTIPYRGHENKLFKRDFAGEFLQKYPETKLIDYGFVYRNDPAFPQDDITWFLIKK